MSIDEDWPDRRAHPRYSPEPHLPVMFTSPWTDLECAGLIVDISEGGLRLVGPPACQVPLVWNDVMTLTMTYSEAARAHGFEGVRIEASVVRVMSDSRAFTVHAHFRERGLHDRLVDYLALLAQERGTRAADTSPLYDRR